MQNSSALGKLTDLLIVKYLKSFEVYKQTTQSFTKSPTQKKKEQVTHTYTSRTSTHIHTCTTQTQEYTHK